MKYFFSSKFCVFIIGFVIAFCGCKKNDISTAVGTTSEGKYVIEIDGYSLVSKAQSKSIPGYDADCLETSSLGMNLDTVANTFVNYELDNITYNSNGTRATDITQIWNSTSGTWINSVRATYNYPNGDTSCSIITVENWKNNQWNLESLQSFTYDNNHHLTQELQQIYNDTTNSWVNIGRIDFTYNTNGQIVQALTTPLLTSNYMLYAKTVYAYDANNILATQTSQTSINSPDNWINSAQEVYTHNADKQIAQAILQYWNPLNNTWSDYDKIVYSYSNSCH